jgi:hypothetical protein
LQIDVLWPPIHVSNTNSQKQIDNR